MKVVYKKTEYDIHGFLLNKDFTKVYDSWKVDVSVLHKLLIDDKVFEVDKQTFVFIGNYPKPFIDNYFKAKYYQVVKK